jgi:acetylornithine/succinyldiaminopimelate/putrescine aminotransferase
MDSLSYNPVLGHINTFGGHPVCCAAGMVAFQVLLEEKLTDGVQAKEELFISLLKHRKINAVRSRGMMMAVEFDSFEMNKQVIDALIVEGIFTDWFLFTANCLRIVPPLIIGDEEITTACHKIIKVLDAL